MTGLNYNIFYKSELPRTGLWSAHWHLFISAFNLTDRVRGVFDKVSAGQKYWIIHNEYNYETSELPAEEKYQSAAEEEGLYISGLIDRIEAGLRRPLSDVAICVDITGFELSPNLGDGRDQAAAV